MHAVIWAGFAFAVDQGLGFRGEGGGGGTFSNVFNSQIRYFEGADCLTVDS